MGEQEFPQTRTSNGGRQYTVDRHEDDETILVVSFEGEEVAELHSPEPDSPARTDGLHEWPLRFEAYPETTGLGPPNEPPVSNALDYVDQALDAAGD